MKQISRKLDETVFERILTALRLLTEQGYEMARVISIAVDVLKQLSTHPNLYNQPMTVELYNYALRNLRLERLKAARPSGQHSILSRDTMLLLQRANCDCERLISKLLVSPVSDPAHSQALHHEIESLAVSIVAAEYLERH